MSKLARELRIGNLLYSTRKIPYEVNAEDILQVDNESTSTAIPITHGWLLNAEFIQDEEDNRRYYHPGTASFELRNITGLDNGFRIIAGFPTDRYFKGISEQIWYVHQLQNIFFALTFKELQFKEIAEFKHPVLTNQFQESISKMEREPNYQPLKLKSLESIKQAPSIESTIINSVTEQLNKSRIKRLSTKLESLGIGLFDVETKDRLLMVRPDTDPSKLYVYLDYLTPNQVLLFVWDNNPHFNLDDDTPNIKFHDLG